MFFMNMPGIERRSVFPLPFFSRFATSDRAPIIILPDSSSLTTMHQTPIDFSLSVICSESTTAAEIIKVWERNARVAAALPECGFQHVRKLPKDTIFLGQQWREEFENCDAT
jgi:hypothetical protein